MFVLQIMNVMLPMGRSDLEEWNDDPEMFYRNQSLNKDKEEHARFASENFLLTLLDRDDEHDLLPRTILSVRDEVERRPISNLRDVLLRDAAYLAVGISQYVLLLFSSSHEYLHTHTHTHKYTGTGSAKKQSSRIGYFDLVYHFLLETMFTRFLFDAFCG